MNDEKFKRLFSEQMSEELKKIDEYEKNIPIHEFSDSFEKKMQKLIISEKRKKSGPILNTTFKKVLCIAATIVLAFGAYFPAKAVCSSVYNFVIEKINNNSDTDDSKLPKITESSVVSYETDTFTHSETQTTIAQPYKEAATKAATSVPTEEEVQTLIAENNEECVKTSVRADLAEEEKGAAHTKLNAATEMSEPSVTETKETAAYPEWNLEENILNVKAGNATVDNVDFLPEDYDSAYYFYNTYGETAVMKGGEKAVIVLPRFGENNWKYETTDHNGIIIESCEAYYTDDEHKVGYDVYCIEFDEEMLGEGDNAYIKFVFVTDYIFNSGEDINLCYNHKGNGIFELDIQPTTVTAANNFIEKNGNIGIFGNKVCMVFTSDRYSKYSAGNMTQTSDNSVLESNKSLILYAYGKATEEYFNYKAYVEKLSGSGFVSSFTFELNNPGQYIEQVVEYRTPKRGDAYIISNEATEEYADAIYTYYFSSDGTEAQIKKAKVCYSGDVNMDGRIDIFDAAVIKDYISGKIALSNEQLALSDYNCDGKTDINDVVAITNTVDK